MKQTPTTSPARNNLPNPIRTLVVDDSVVLLEGLCTYLEAQPLFQVIGTAMHGSEALHMTDLLQPDLVLMDLNMPVMDGLQAAAILRRRVPHIRIIIMTLEDSAATEAKALVNGAHGFIGKLQITSDHLITVVRRAFRSNRTKD